MNDNNTILCEYDINNNDRTLNQLLEKLFHKNGIEYIRKNLVQLTYQSNIEKLIKSILVWCNAEQIRAREIHMNETMITQPTGDLLVFCGKTRRPCLLLEVNQHYLIYGLNKLPMHLTNEIFQNLLPNALYFCQSPHCFKLIQFFYKIVPIKIIKRIIGFSLLSSLLGLTVPIATSILFDEVIPFRDLSLYTQTAYVFFAITLSLIGCSIIKNLAVMQFSLSCVLQGERALWDKLLKIPLRILSHYSSADLVLRVQTFEALNDELSITVLMVLVGLMISMATACALIYFSSTLFFMALFFIALIAMIYFPMMKFLLKKMRQHEEQNARVEQLSLESISLIDKVHLNNANNFVLKKWRSQFIKMKNYEVVADKLVISLDFISQVILSLSLLLFFYYMASRTNQFPLGAMIASLSIYMLLIQSAKDFCLQIFNFMKILPTLERGRIIIETPSEQTGQGIKPKTFTGAMKIEQLTFGYENCSEVILDKLSLTVKPGECVAIVGHSGAGKSTLLKCLLGMLTLQQGTIQYDGHDLNTLNLSYLHQQCGIITQNSQLMSGSLLDNIRVGTEMSYNQVMTVCKQLGVAEWIDQLPMKLNTQINSEQVTLSGGQQQMILLARAIARHPCILFLDEATSALDNAMQKTINYALYQLNITRVMIAHRISTIKLADKIYVLNQGTIMQQGSYSELISQQGLFTELVKNSH